jgi:hypothetical protein
MIVHDVEQGTLAWLQLHLGIPTASGLDNLLTTGFEQRTGEMVRTYIFKKVAEAWRGKPLVSLGSGGNWDTEQGMILETEAIPWFELEYETKVKRVGFITTDDNRFGCSPDGLIESEDCGLEIKCPAAHTHVKYLIDGKLPNDYAAQVHGGMFATGFKKWLFVSYRRGFPALLVEVERDEEIQAKIQLAVHRFHADFATWLAKVKTYENSDGQRPAL